MTLEAMRKLAVDGSKDLEVREAAIQAVRAAGARGHDTLAELAAVYRFVRDDVEFRNDIVGVETVQSPRYTLHVRAGDCDDRAVLLVALARSLGLPATLRFRAIGTPQSRGRFSHVYVMANAGGHDIALDPTYQSMPFGGEYPHATRVADYAI